MSKFSFSFAAVSLTVLSMIIMAGCKNSLLPYPGSEKNSASGLQTPQPPQGSQIPQNPQGPTWYVSAGGNNSGGGADSSKPLATVQAALDKIKSEYRGGKWPAGKSAVIVVSGTVTGSGSFKSNQAMVDISGAGNYPPVILMGDPVKGGVLNANRNRNDEGRVLYIGNNTVTLGDNLTLTGGYTLWGGAVCVGTHGKDSKGEFIMAGGEISGNTASLGGGVLIYKGKMTMTGGEIKINTTSKSYGNVMGTGGGVFVGEGTAFTMSGGTISGNGGAETDKGGGVAINGDGLFTMTGGDILNNTSTEHGGGVHISPLGKFAMSGGTVNGNTSAASGGVNVSSYGAVFDHTGGTISGNTPNN
ncbi:MAG: hypothetical protein LBJ90_07200 [Treponema sp.]|jgi:hypothetical protein|nr:hypothetical protein [Treponema sp.]